MPPAFNAIHVVTGPHGKVLLVAGSGNDWENLARGTFRTFPWDTATNTRKQIPTPEDLFCAGHVLLPDGRALIAGGTTSYLPFKGESALYAFNFTIERYEGLPPLEVGRWYPSAVTTPQGNALIVGGLDENGVLTDHSEIFQHRTNTHRLLTSRRTFPLYPHLFLTAKRTYFYTGAAFAFPDMHAPGFWDPFSRNSFRSVVGLTVPARRASAASCLIGDARDQVLMILGGGAPATGDDEHDWHGCNRSQIRGRPPSAIAETVVELRQLARRQRARSARREQQPHCGRQPRGRAALR